MRAVWISANSVRAAKPLTTEDEVAGIRGFGLFFVFRSGLFAGFGSIHEARSFSRRNQRSIPTAERVGFALRSVAGWSLPSNAAKIQRAEAVVSGALLRFQISLGWGALLASACFGAPPNQSFNGTGFQPAR